MTIHPESQNVNASALPEAPCSINEHIIVGARRVQITARADTPDEAAARFVALHDSIARALRTPPVRSREEIITALFLRAVERARPLPDAERSDRVERLSKALTLALLGHVAFEPDGTALVRSLDGTREYRVTKFGCECPDTVHRGVACCKHAAAQHMARRAAIELGSLLE